MKSYVWVTFAFMAWGYYEASGGADFVPAQPVVAETTVQEPEIVTRAPTTTLLSLSTSNVEPDLDDAEVVAEAIALDTIETVPDVVALVEPTLDIRAVLGTRVNMRRGPGTGFDVITTLDGGTELEILSVDAQGWANVSTELGLEGWMAARLLTDPET